MEQGKFDLLAPAPAGISLTEDNRNYPWGNPPKYADPNKAMDAAINSLESPVTRTNLVKSLMAGISVESLVEGFIYAGFESGKFSLDTALIMKPSLALYLASIAEEEEIPYRFFESDIPLDEDEIDDTHMLKIMKKNNPRMFQFIKEKVNEEIRTGGQPQELDDNFLNAEREVK
tara:strand:+ start:259 stop:780 length:522 start_codon:yes stop_codon:yes gene_type:complete